MTVHHAAQSPTAYVDVGGARIAYRSIGSGTPLILANRMRATLDLWDPLFLDTLAQAHRVITFDYSGTGYSEGELPSSMRAAADLIVGLADALGIDTFALCGWSWGGAATQTAVVEHPKRITHAVLTGTSPPGKPTHPIRQVFLERAFKPLSDLDDEIVLFFDPDKPRSRVAAAASHARIFGGRTISASEIDVMIEATHRQTETFVTVFVDYQADAEGRLEALTRSDIPMLIIAGDNDSSNDTRNWLPLIGRLPRGQFLILPEAGHGPHHQYPVQSARSITAFLAE